MFLWSKANFNIASTQNVEREDHKWHQMTPKRGLLKKFEKSKGPFKYYVIRHGGRGGYVKI